MAQIILTCKDNYKDLDNWIRNKALLVCDGSFEYLNGIRNKITDLSIPVVRFSDFKPNPLQESVDEGIKLFLEEKCDCIIAIGGGSAIDVAKCIKLFSNKTDTPLLAIPTTAGTGSEATRYAVVYKNGEKQSITDDCIIPDAVLLDPDCLKTLPVYQKKATMCDALCHAIESYWSVNSTDESKEYARQAIDIIIRNMDDYLSNKDNSGEEMLRAANLAGKAINISQTTAGHAMSYKITSLFGSSHGHAAILCDRILYKWMVDNTDRCIDPRGEEYIKSTLDEIGISLGCSNAAEGASNLQAIFDKLGLDIPAATEEQYGILKTSVNPVRLKNHPIELDNDTIDELYHLILR